MVLVNAGAFFRTVFWAEVIPGGGGYVAASIVAPFDVGLEAQDTSTFTPHIASEHKRADVEADAVV